MQYVAVTHPRADHTRFGSTCMIMRETLPYDLSLEKLAHLSGAVQVPHILIATLVKTKRS